MAQVNRNGGSATKPKISMIENYAKNLSINTTANFVNLLDIDSRGDSTGNIIIHNDAGGDLDYRVLVNCQHIDDITTPTATDATNRDNGWRVLTTGQIATTEEPEEYNFANNYYTKIFVQVKHTSGTTVVSCWYRGTKSQ